MVDNCFFAKESRTTLRKNGSVKAHPGYFAIGLNTSIHTEMTVTNHTALYRITFPTAATVPGYNESALPYSPLILVDLIDLPDTRVNGYIEINEKNGRITGNGTFSPSFGLGSYNLYFCADFSGALVRDTGVFMNSRAGNQPKGLQISPNGNDRKIPAGAWAQFHSPENNQILARVGVSFISVEKACRNSETEIPDFSFNKTLETAEDAWRDKLSVIEVDATGVSDDFQTIFWSGVYRSLISPQDYTGENPRWQSDEPSYDSFYCIWDSFRTIHPLLTILDPQSQTLMIRSLIDIYRHEGIVQTISPRSRFKYAKFS